MSTQKKIFFGPCIGGFWRSGPQKFWETKLRLQLNNFTQKLDSEKSTQDLESKKKSSWPKVVGRDERVS